MSEAELRDIEQLLGHNIDPGGSGSIRDLYDIPSTLLEDARKLDSLTLNYRLLRHYTPEKLWPWLPAFIDDVVDGGVDLPSWMRGGILYPLFSLEALVTMDVEEILSVLDPTPDEVWLQFAPDRDAWRIGETVTGAPAVARPELRYDSETSEHVRRVLLNGLESLLPVDDIEVATRRWIASQIAARAAKFGGVERFEDSGSLFETAFPTIENPSLDAHIATRGLLREVRELGQSEVDVPGFRGPSDWYRDIDGKMNPS